MPGSTGVTTTGPAPHGAPTLHVDARGAISRAKVSAVGFAAFAADRDVLVAGEGMADRPRKLDATATTVFEAASIAKLIVATCVMQLVEERRLDLDADVAAYVGFPVRHPRFAAPITLRKLLTHRASLRDRDDELTAPAAGNLLGPFLVRYVRQGAAPRAAAFLDDARPGTTTNYSNVGAALAALAVERVAREGFAELSARRVFVPLRMTDTGWAAPPEGAASAATPYAAHGEDFVALPRPSHAVYPAVDLHSTARDLARFGRAILREGDLEGRRILSAASVQAMLRPDAAASDQALAWQLRTLGGQRVVGHEGEDAGASTALFLDLASGTGAIILANGDAFGSGDVARAGALETMLVELLRAAR
jgi:CubicO group peptidase (beta-lactamase class C family)